MGGVLVLVVAPPATLALVEVVGILALVFLIGSGGGFGRLRRDVIELLEPPELLLVPVPFPSPLLVVTLMEDGSNLGGAGRGVFVLLGVAFGLVLLLLLVIS